MLELPSDRLMDVLIHMWVEYHIEGKEVIGARLALGRALDDLSRVEVEAEEVFDDMTANPFPGVMRGGPAGVISHSGD